MNRKGKHMLKCKPFFLFLLCVCILIGATGCKSSLYNTDIYGTYGETLYSEDTDNPIGIYRLTLNSDNTYEWYLFENYKNDEEETEISYEGSIVSIEDINKDIVKITLDNDNPSMSSFFYTYFNISNKEFYKYKNLIGTYIPVDLRRNADFFIQNNNVPGDGRFFSTNGTTIYKYADGLTSDVLNYKIKSDIIWIDFDVGYGYQPYYYIVDGGVFEGAFSKQQ